MCVAVGVVAKLVSYERFVAHKAREMSQRLMAEHYLRHSLHCAILMV